MISFRLELLKRKPSHERVKQAIDMIKILIRQESDECYRKQLAQTGIELNKIFLNR